MMEFLAMGGYALYVWPAYGAALLVLGSLTVNAVLRYRSAERELASLNARRPGGAR